MAGDGRPLEEFLVLDLTRMVPGAVLARILHEGSSRNG